MSILKMIGSTSFLMANKELIKATDIESAILYSDLAGAYDYWQQNNSLTDGYFFRTQSEIEENTTLSAKVQLRCLRILQEKGLIKTKVKGLPARKYFCIDSECMYRLSQVLQKGETSIAERENQDEPKGRIKLQQKGEISSSERENQVSTKVPSINNRVNNNKEIIIDNNNKEQSNFSFLENDPELISLNDKKTTLEILPEVVYEKPKKDKEQERAENAKYYFEVTQILELLTERSGVKYRVPETKSAIERYDPYKLIKERINDKAKLEDFFAIIEMKHKEWSGTKIYKNFIPSTLFRKSNFDKYLQQLQLTDTTKDQTNSNNQFKTKEDATFAHYYSQLRNVDYGFND